MQQPLYFENENQLMAGTLHVPDGATAPVPGLIMVHGFTGHKAETHFIFTKLSRALEAAGIASLRFDCRGSGESGGEFRDMTVGGEVSDARRALQVLKEHAAIEADRVGLLGLSLGGCVAAHVAGLEPGVKACVLWAAVARPAEVLQRRVEEGPAVPPAEGGGWDLGGLHLGTQFVAELPSVDPVAHLKKATAAVLIIHGEEDAAVPVAHADLYLEAATAAGLVSERFLLPGADHVFSSLPWERQVIEKTVAWFKRWL